ncbi:MAG: hypothetical protein V1913_02150 [Fibrobacterota bacterium]
MMNRFAGLLLLLVVAVVAEFPGLKWDASVSTVLDRYPDAVRNRCCYFEGVNIFGRDSLEIYTEPLAANCYERRTFLFYKKKLVQVELKCAMDSVTPDNFEAKIIDPLKKKLGSKTPFTHAQDDKTKNIRFYQWRTKTDMVLAMFGHFKKVTPANLDWSKVSYYKRDFYDFKSQGKPSVIAEGEWKIVY